MCVYRTLPGPFWLACAIALPACLPAWRSSSSSSIAQAATAATNNPTVPDCVAPPTGLLGFFFSFSFLIQHLARFLVFFISFLSFSLLLSCYFTFLFHFFLFPVSFYDFFPPHFISVFLLLTCATQRARGNNIFHARHSHCCNVGVHVCTRNLFPTFFFIRRLWIPLMQPMPRWKTGHTQWPRTNFEIRHEKKTRNKQDDQNTWKTILLIIYIDLFFFLVDLGGGGVYIHVWHSYGSTCCVCSVLSRLIGREVGNRRNRNCLRRSFRGTNLIGE